MKLTTNKNEMFKPIKVAIEFEIKTAEELNNLRDEFYDGVLSEFTTAYSKIIYDLLVKLRDEFYER